MLRRTEERGVKGVIRLMGYEELQIISDIRVGLKFPESYEDMTLSCLATAPLGRPIREYSSVRELLYVLRDLVRALESLYIKGRILHRDIAIKNLIIAPANRSANPEGVLIDLNASLDTDNRQPIEPTVGSDGFMAIGVLYGQPHSYRHDLESLFYVFLWFAIANDREHDEALQILSTLPETSRLRNWCSMDFLNVGTRKQNDMGTEGFEVILEEFNAEFRPLQGLARDLHALIFPIRHGKIYIGTNKDEGADKALYDGMASAFERYALVS